MGYGTTPNPSLMGISGESFFVPLIPTTLSPFLLGKSINHSWKSWSPFSFAKRVSSSFPSITMGKGSPFVFFLGKKCIMTFQGNFWNFSFPISVRKRKQKITQEAEEVLRWAFPGMSWEINRSQFHSLYFFPKVWRFLWLHEGEYDNEKIHLRSGEVVSDIGACMGVFSVLAGLAVGETGRVYAFEPLEKYASVLKANITLNGLRNVTAVEKALGDSSGTVRMEGITIVDGTGNIPVTTIDAFVREQGIERIDFLKMDVEGFERKVLSLQLPYRKEFNGEEISGILNG